MNAFGLFALGTVCRERILILRCGYILWAMKGFRYHSVGELAGRDESSLSRKQVLSEGIMAEDGVRYGGGQSQEEKSREQPSPFRPSTAVNVVSRGRQKEWKAKEGFVYKVSNVATPIDSLGRAHHQTTAKRIIKLDDPIRRGIAQIRFWTDFDMAKRPNEPS